MENEEAVNETVVESREAATSSEYAGKTYEFKTELGKAVKSGEIKDIDEILGKHLKILEPQIVDFLIPNLQVDFLYVGQSKGKLGGGKRRIIRNTQKVTAKAKRQHFSAMAVVGDGNGHIGIGKGRGLESVIAKEKALKNAKLNIISILRGCGSWECACHGSHSIPFKVSGKCGSVVVTLLPAPKGISFCVMDDIKTIMRLAGIKDVWSKVNGQTNTRINIGYATFEALKSLNYYRFFNKEKENLGIKG
ncbi:MAG: 30S ribosomal protein S5 [Candidatus Parvarchaeota archaeon]|nr:30S ribosomal protein S5 [Candidatus Parvarchaeum tengchongense]MCW1295070.1 30S ribosomal protein S5 [Candidatus Parvarchaeum tengchongense]MCW1299374.1 30S ribosomal protein S5 [Candidatus Parvarchaeum tengchongense]MCW1312655.1 30S ribosomal protein S5 [Candidatus Parvarchaeum tengchongense]